MITESNALGQPQPIQFSLRSLFVALAVAGLLLAPIRWFGAGYVISLIASLGLTASCLWFYRTHHPGAMFGVSILGIIGAMILFSSALALHAVLNAVGCGLCLLISVRPRTVAGMLSGALIAAYGLVIWGGANDYRELSALLATYPMESLESRLAFETRSEATSRTATHAKDDSVLSEHVRANLSSFEEHQDYAFSRRALALRRLHDETYRQFALAAGFGSVRMGSVHAEWVELEPREPIHLPLPVKVVSLAPLQSELESVHRGASADFLTPERMGYVRKSNQVAGFEAHGFSALPKQLSDGKHSPRWQVARLELVSLLRHDEPRVYIASTLPQMDELADVPHRPLNEFEQGALPELETKEDLVFISQQERIQMLGAIRSGVKCVECHDGERGRLLGAFSYEITPIASETPTLADARTKSP